MAARQEELYFSCRHGNARGAVVEVDGLKLGTVAQVQVAVEMVGEEQIGRSALRVFGGAHLRR